MTATAAPEIVGLTEPVGLDELTAAELLACVGDAETAERRAGLAKLELALQWCVLHPASEETGAAVWGDAGLPGFTQCDEALGGEGCPQVAAYAPEPFAAALGVSTLAGMQVLADALDLAHRLPRTWALVRALGVAPWKARRLAQATHRLSAQAAAFVDARLVDRLDACGVVLIDRVVSEAAARFEPEPQADAEEAGKASWDVHLTHRVDGGFAGTSHLEATGDTLDLTKFYDLVCDQAAQLAELGDADTLGQRKAKALGMIADAQGQLDLTSQDPPQVRRRSLTKTRAYLHLSLTDVLGLPDGLARAGEVERLGPLTVARIREWLGSTRATIVPVLHLGEVPPEHERAVDEHDPPPAMREEVILRDRHCVFPWCQIGSRSCDLDHIDPYLPLDEGGPPDQTRPSNLAPLCRRHHNVKTARRWRYRRNPDGSYTWHGPHGRSFCVTGDGTRRIEV